MRRVSVVIHRIDDGLNYCLRRRWEGVIDLSPVTGTGGGGQR